jgi:hypothetical protein
MNTTVAERDGAGKFQVGHTGIGGRPQGSRNLLGEAFLKDLYTSWQENGERVLRRLIDEDPAAYAKIIALLVAKSDNDGLPRDTVTVVNVITGVRG